MGPPWFDGRGGSPAPLRKRNRVVGRLGESHSGIEPGSRRLDCERAQYQVGNETQERLRPGKLSGCGKCIRGSAGRGSDLRSRAEKDSSERETDNGSKAVSEGQWPYCNGRA